jgi:hypothetical protein
VNYTSPRAEVDRLLAGESTKTIFVATGALAIDPGDSTRLICATGEGNMSSDCYPGSGVYVTGDAGLTSPGQPGSSLRAGTRFPSRRILITPAEQQLRGLAVLEIEPRRRKGIKKLWLGTNRLWRTDNDGKSWKPVSHSFDDSAISAIECAVVNPRVLFVGTSLGKIFRSTDGGITWSGNLANAAIPQRLITRIGTHPKCAKRVVATVAASGVPGTSLDTSSSPGLPYLRAFESDDLGLTWRSPGCIARRGLQRLGIRVA